MDYKRSWHHLSTGELEAILHTDSATGLSHKEAARRLRRGRNKIWRVQNVGVGRYAQKTFMDFATVLLVLAVIGCAFFGDGLSAIIICLFILLGRCARIATYVSARRSLDKNAAAALPTAKVVREGNVKVVPADMIVVGDVIILDAGDTVPCDIRLTAADRFAVCESFVTDNEGVIAKNCQSIPSGARGEVPVTMRKNMLYATSAVISGFGIGIAVATGAETLVCAREGEVELSGGDKVPVLEKLSDWSRICSLCLLGAAFVITVLGVAFGGSSLVKIFMPSIALAAACLSEYLGAVGALSWAVALRRRDGGVMRSAAAAELCAASRKLVLRSPDVLKSGVTTLHSYYRNSELSLMGTKGAGIPHRLLSLACYCTGTSPKGSIAKGAFGSPVRHTGVLSYDLVHRLCEENGVANKDMGYTIIQHVAAGEENSDGFDNVLLANGNDYFFCAMGKVTRLLSICSYYRMGDKIIPLTMEEREKILGFAKNLNKRGVILCAVGFRRSNFNNLKRISVLQSSMCFEGFFAVSDRMEEGALDMINAFRSGGGSVVIFSDESDEDRYFCEAEGVFKTGDNYFTYEETATLKDFVPDAGSLSIISTGDGVDSIRERLRLLKNIQGEDNDAVYIGHGIEDMWNMQAAGVSFAVIPPGSKQIPQALRTTADGLCSSGGGGFCQSFRIMRRCRHALSNIKNILKYLIVSHVARLVLMLFLAAAGLPLLSAVHIVFWGLVLDFALSFAIAHVPYVEDRDDFKSTVKLMPDNHSEVLLLTLYGAVLTVFSVAAPFIGRALLTAMGHPTQLSDGGVLSCIFVSIILAMCFVAAEISGGFGLFSSKSVWGKMFFVPIGLGVLGIAAELFATPLHSATGSEFPGWLMLAFTLVPTVMVVAIMSVVRALNVKKVAK